MKLFDKKTFELNCHGNKMSKYFFAYFIPKS